jgi:hypothetical protein
MSLDVTPHSLVNSTASEERAASISGWPIAYHHILLIWTSAGWEQIKLLPEIRK